MSHSAISTLRKLISSISSLALLFSSLMSIEPLINAARFPGEQELDFEHPPRYAVSYVVKHVLFLPPSGNHYICKQGDYGHFFTLQKILFPTIKFDSICAIFNTSPRIIHAILSPKEEQFWIKRYPNILSRINIKPRRPIGLSKGMSANIFQSGKCLIFGACNLKDINAFIRLMKKSIQQMK